MNRTLQIGLVGLLVLVGTGCVDPIDRRPGLRPDMGRFRPLFKST